MPAVGRSAFEALLVGAKDSYRITKWDFIVNQIAGIIAPYGIVGK